MLANYFKIALKVLLRRKFFTFISLFAIGFTLIVLIVAAAMFDHQFGPHEVEAKQERTLGVYGLMMAGEKHRYNGFPGYKFLDRYVRTLPDVERVSIASTASTISTYVSGRKLSVALKHTDGEYWRVFSFRFLQGRPFTVEDDAKGNRVAIINEATRAKFFGTSSALGKTIDLDSQRFTVIGVVENVPLTRLVPYSDVWVPIGTIRTQSFRNSMVGSFVAVVVAKSRADFPKIKQEFAARMQRVESPDPKTFNRFVSGVETPFEFLSRQTFGRMEKTNPAALTFAIAVLAVLFMVLPAVNLVNINMSRILERASEIGVRKAFGASSRTLVGQFVVENLIVTFAAGVLSLIASALILYVINASALIPYSDFALNIRVFGYGMVFCLIFGLVSGVYPAYRMSRLNPVNALRGGVR